MHQSFFFSILMFCAIWYTRDFKVEHLKIHFRTNASCRQIETNRDTNSYDPCTADQAK